MTVDIDIKSDEPFQITEEMKIKAQELRYDVLHSCDLYITMNSYRQVSSLDYLNVSVRFFLDLSSSLHT